MTVLQESGGGGGGGEPGADGADGLDAFVCTGRLTLTSATPVTTADVTAGTTLYCALYNGNRMSLWNGSAWEIMTFTEPSLSYAGMTAGKPHDIFAYDVAGTLTLEAVAWTNDTTRATALAMQNGIPVKNGTPARRYLGTVYTFDDSGTVKGKDSAAHRWVWNYYNRVPVGIAKYSGATAFSQNSATPARYNSDDTLRVEVVCGAPSTAHVRFVLYPYPGASEYSLLQVGLNSNDTPVATNQKNSGFVYNTAVQIQMHLEAHYTGPLDAGRHYFVPLITTNAAVDFSGEDFDRVEGMVFQ